MNRYNPDSVHKRVGYIQFNYKNKNFPSNFENFMFPIVLYDRNGIVTDANGIFRKLTQITKDDIQNNAINIFDRLDGNQAGFTETARNAFDGKENVYIGSGCLLKTNNSNPGKYELSRYTNAIFFPIARNRDGISLAGILLDENKTDDDTEGAE